MVRVWGDTAVVTALLWAKGREKGASFAYRVWFSDTYARVDGVWKYVLGHASSRLPWPERSRRSTWSRITELKVGDSRQCPVPDGRVVTPPARGGAEHWDGLTARTPLGRSNTA